MDYTIEGSVFRNGVLEHACIGYEDGRIVAIKKILHGNNHKNFGNHLILPAGIDIHVHFRDPGFTHKEDFASGSLSAAYGGISCVFDMPNTQPHTTTLESLQQKKEIAEKKSYIDFGVYAGITDENIHSINSLSKDCNGFKIFLGNSTHALHFNEYNLPDVLDQTQHLNTRTLFHAESETCLMHHVTIEQTLKDHIKARPAICEETSLRILNKYSTTIPSPVHICHLSSYRGVETLQNHPPTMTIGVTPHHLFLDISKPMMKETYYKVNPPIREPTDRQHLWNALVKGQIDLIESDHAPHTIEEKEQDFPDAPSGVPGVETMLPIMLAAVKQGQISLSRVIETVAEKPAQLFGIKKGRLDPGYDADFVVIDFKKIQRIKSDNLHSKCGWTPFEEYLGMFPRSVFVRGEKIIDDYECSGHPGFGQQVHGEK